MERSSNFRDRDRDGDKDGRKGGMSFHRRKICRFCADSTLAINYKDYKMLRLFTTERGKIVPRRISGNCAKHQRMITVEINRARYIALLPYTTASVR
ncbi:MAG: 30S ribosomal protein S18 [Deltaproteobacteria bacterium]|jgi:small subunit ribosomal protein S18|nr:30S ribosomal protein S18 [Deltaproteobacteria bacterium]